MKGSLHDKSPSGLVQRSLKSLTNAVVGWDAVDE